MKNVQFCVASVLLLSGVIIFFPVFFAARPYTDIRTNIDFYQMTATILNTSISSAYCPTKHCSSCSQAPDNVPSCNAASQRIASINPTTCGLNSSSSMCPSNTDCGDGETCCATGCIAYAQSCSGSGKSYTCTTYCAAYTCISSVSNLDCYIRPDVCYTSTLYLSYIDRSGDTVRTTYSQNFGGDVNNAQDFVMYEYVPGHSYTMYYDHTNERRVVLSIEYHGVDMAFAMLFAFLMLLGIIGCVDVFLTTSVSEFSSWYCCGVCRTPSPTSLIARCFPAAGVSNETRIRAFEWFFWVSLVIGLVLFLNLYYAPNIGYTGRVALLVVVMQCVTIGEMGLVWLWVRQTGQNGIWVVWFVLHYIPWGWLLPFKDQIANGNVVYVVVIVLGSLVLAGVGIVSLFCCRREIQYKDNIGGGASGVQMSVAAVPVDAGVPPPPYLQETMY